MQIDEDASIDIETSLLHIHVSLMIEYEAGFAWYINLSQFFKINGAA
jgi:hypothetical protein